jgi:hypothetical protein
MSTGQKLLLGCGVVAIAVAGCLVLMIGGCMGMFMKGAKDFPAYAKAGVADPANRDVTDRINKIIADSSFMSDARKKITAETWPPKVLLIEFKEGNATSTQVFARYPNTNSNFTYIMNGNGYGSVSTPDGKKEVVIIERRQTMSGGSPLDYVLYVEHLPGSGSP